jgi:murein DD-endopeptidase MepM/ murein hydrolase activator NlpD
VRRLGEVTAQSRHDGIDIAGAAGTPVRAANRGVVTVVAGLFYGGTTVLVDHGGGLVTSYQHLSGVFVAVGDTVARGAVIGACRRDGDGHGPSPPLGVSYGSVVVDPAALLALAIPR